jgi:superfamily I DNA and RNA helicase and helicase subunits-like protein
MNPQNEKSILSFWHKLEFFTPFDAKIQDREDIANTTYTLDQLSKLAVGGQKNQSIIHHHLQEKPEFCNRYPVRSKIYFNLFNSGCLSKSIQDLLQEQLSENEQYTQEAMSADKGETCYALLPVNDKGEFNPAEIEVSTAPWAVGLSIAKGLGSLDFEAFETDCGKLLESLAELSKRHLSMQQVEHPEAIQPVLSSSLLLDIAGRLKEWAYDYCPEPITIRIISECQKHRRTASGKTAKNQNHTEKSEKNNESAKDDANTADEEIGILNSFYAKDILSIIRQIGQNKNSAALSAYLGSKSTLPSTDLYGANGNKTIWENLRPKYWNKGRWLSEPQHGLSLMQQFAINTFFLKDEQPVFSVNGPPGTGKTTLLRDIFAENIVRRATRLAELATAQDAFSGTEKVNGSTVSRLKPELTGFEMIVASSNNAAVENISRDLPKKSSLGATYCTDNHPSYVYLDKIARNLFAKNKQKYDTLDQNDDTWGLFSCALGKKSNRKKVQQGLFFVPQNPDECEGYDEALHQSIWKWCNNYQGISFAQAQKNFKRQLDIVEQKLNDLDGYFILHEETVLNPETNQAALQQQYGTCAKSVQTEKEKLNDARQARIETQTAELQDIPVHSDFILSVSDAQSRLQAAIQKVNMSLTDEDGEQRAYWQSQIESLKLSYPGFFMRLFKRKQCREHRERLAYCYEQLSQLHLAADNRKKSAKQEYEHCAQSVQAAQAALAQEQKRVYQQKITAAKEAEEAAEERLKTVQQQLEQVGIRLAQWQEKQNVYQQYQNRFMHIRLPEKYDELQKNDFQIAGLWQDDELNNARSRLFGCALQLHEAWLAEVAMTGGGFGSNLVLISKFLQGSAGLNKEQTLSVWQSLFMVIPVVSSTFASFARQFRDVGAGCLGYLFIDEAGQAVPQAAVGAIWRAKRVMAVGDPIQIEPVFTTPPPLVRTLERIAALPDCADVSPTEVSVQILADRCNAFGASVLRKGESEATWIGSPLRVHRRCADPMFSIANYIAYDNKMIFGNTDPAKRQPPKQDFYLGSSSWIQVAGEATSRQFVQEQADLVIRMLIEIVRHSGGLPDLYIITPFKQIKTELCKKIAGDTALKNIEGLQQWCRMRIGTVHTFQGKEEKMVWLVLGCDAKTDSAAQWAAGKPNLLNVALTRAKHYVFVIGDKDLWADKKYFDVAAKNLPQIDAREFYSRAEQLPSSTNNVFS